MSFQTRQGFWREAFALHGSITPQVMPLVLAFGLAASGICGVSWLIETLFQAPGRTALGWVYLKVTSRKERRQLAEPLAAAMASLYSGDIHESE